MSHLPPHRSPFGFRHPVEAAGPMPAPLPSAPTPAPDAPVPPQGPDRAELGEAEAEYLAGLLAEEMSRAMAAGSALPANFDLLSLMPSVQRPQPARPSSWREDWVRRLFTFL